MVFFLLTNDKKTQNEKKPFVDFSVLVKGQRCPWIQ
jgi:hypothetical protein